MKSIVLAALCLLIPPFVPGSVGLRAGEDFRTTDAALIAYERRDFKTAMGLFLPSARRGDARAQTWVGVKYLSGDGVKRNHAAALDWLRRAAGQNFGEAYYRLGLIYDYGDGLPVDKVRAAEHYAAAAERGHVDAQLTLSERHFFGVGVKYDLVRAYVWADIATRLARSGHQLYTAEGNRETLAEMMPPGRIAEARRLAGQWWAAHGGFR